MTDLTTAFGNPLSLLVLLPIVAGATLMLISWAAPPSQRKDLARHVRMLSFGLSLLLFALATLMFLESYSGIEWFSLSLNEYAYENCTTGQIEAGACALLSGIGGSWHVGGGGLSFPLGWLAALLGAVSVVGGWEAKKGA